MFIPDFSYFLVVAKELNISQAAAACHITQQSMSNYIKRLESHYNVQLFTRTPSLQLTSEGTQFLLAAEKIEKIMADLKKDISITSKSPVLINIGISTPVSRVGSLIPAAIISDEMPHVRLRIVEEDLTVLFSALLADQIDILITNSHLLTPDIQHASLPVKHSYLVISETTLNYYFPDGYNTALNRWQNGIELIEFAQIPTVQYSIHGNSFNKISAYCYSNGINLAVQFTINNITSILNAVAEYNIWGYCPADALPKDKNPYIQINGKRLYTFPIINPNLDYSINIYYKKSKNHSIEFKRVLKQITQSL